MLLTSVENSDGEADEEIKPTRKKSIFLKIKSDKEIESQFSTDFGMWILPFKEELMDSSWEKACRLYSERSLPGIAFLSTMKNIIVFHGGPLENERMTSDNGQILAKRMEYVRSVGLISLLVNVEEDNSLKVGRNVSVPASLAAIR